MANEYIKVIKEMNILLSIFNSEETTLAVNIIVTIAFLFFMIYLIQFIIKKFKPDVLENSFQKNIETSSTYQNIYAFTSVVLASTFFKLFTGGEYHMIWVVVIISITTIFFHILYDKISNTNFAIKKYLQYEKHINIIDKLMNSKGYRLIIKASEVEKIENRDTTKEIYVFTENLITDLPKKDTVGSENNSENRGLFVDIVSKNIPKEKKYTYFLKDNNKNREYAKEYYAYHFSLEANKVNSKNIDFYFVEESEFTFFTELYLYKDEKENDRAFEWLPAIGEKGRAEKQFYLKLSSEQVENINEIIIELKNPSMRFNYNNYEEIT